MPRPLVSTLFYSVDGVASDPHLFQHDSFDEELGQWMTEAIGRADTAIMGRTTYSEWADYWPGVTPEEDAGFADFINTVPKHIASRTLTQADLTWRGSTLIEDDLLDHVRQLKDRQGGEISVLGSLSLVRQLVDSGLMDSLTLCVHPAIAGSGRRLFDGSAPGRLRLREARSTEKGNILATYGPYR